MNVENSCVLSINLTSEAWYLRNLIHDGWVVLCVWRQLLKENVKSNDKSEECADDDGVGKTWIQKATSVLHKMILWAQTNVNCKDAWQGQQIHGLHILYRLECIVYPMQPTLAAHKLATMALDNDRFSAATTAFMSKRCVEQAKWPNNLQSLQDLSF